MTQQLIQNLTTSELNGYAVELEQAVENHIRWLNNLNKALLGHKEADPNNLIENPHLLCHFGRWYHGIDAPCLQRLPEFTAIGPVHEQMHQVARELLLEQQYGKPVDAATYDLLIQLTDQLRQQLNALRLSLKSNLTLLSSLMGRVFENAGEGVMITAVDGTIVSVNQSFCQYTGYAAEEVLGRQPNILHSGRQGDAFYRHMWQSLQQEGQWEGEIWNRRKDGKNYLEWLSISAIRNGEGNPTHYVAVFSDITSEKENEKRLYQLAHYDQLTELPNRMLFLDRLKQGLSRARRNNRRVAVMFLDLDGFKPVNDRFGHQVGDELLRQIAKRLSDTLRASDTVSRFGGDEFTVAIPDLGHNDDIAHVAQKITEAVAQPCTIDGKEVAVTTSIGISLYPDDGDNGDMLISCADLAMYEAKKVGKNNYRFFGALA